MNAVVFASIALVNVMFAADAYRHSMSDGDLLSLCHAICFALTAAVSALVAVSMIL